MMMTDAAVWSLDESWRSLRQRVTSWFRPVVPCASDAELPRFVESGVESGVSASKQAARVAAIRALLYAREGDLAHAERFFSDAFHIDPELSPADVPTFWSLSRTGQEAAVSALHHANRPDDAERLADAVAACHRQRLAS